MSLEQLKHLFQQIAKTPPQDYDSQMLQLIKKFTTHAFAKQEKEKNEEAKPQWFGLDLLWKFVQTSDQTSMILFVCSLCIFVNYNNLNKQKHVQQKGVVRNERFEDW